MRWLLHIAFALVLWSCPRAIYAIDHQANFYDTTIRTGDTRLNEYLPALHGKRVALLINQTAVCGNELLLDVLLRNKVNIVKIFSPEHGFRGNADAGATVTNSIDSATGIPVVSLYGGNKKPNKEQLKDVDILLYDLQDVGVRFYTYISTLQYAMEACAENNVQFILLDRPNPNGHYVDGPVLDTALRSFVGTQAIPIVYGMTAGEYAQMLVGEHLFQNAGQLHLKVIACRNYDHTKKYLIPVSPSPNLRTMAAIYGYPSMCLFEGTPVSVGRGTDMPFQQWGSPELGKAFAYTFVPAAKRGAAKPMYESKTCYGEMIGNNEQAIEKTINDHLYLGWLIAAYNAYPDKQKFFTAFFDKLAGNTTLKEQIKSGRSEEEIRKSWASDLRVFKAIRKKYLLYKDFE